MRSQWLRWVYARGKRAACLRFNRSLTRRRMGRQRENGIGAWAKVHLFVRFVRSFLFFPL